MLKRFMCLIVVSCLFVGCESEEQTQEIDELNQQIGEFKADTKHLEKQLRSAKQENESLSKTNRALEKDLRRERDQMSQETERRTNKAQERHKTAITKLQEKHRSETAQLKSSHKLQTQQLQQQIVNLREFNAQVAIHQADEQLVAQKMDSKKLTSLFKKYDYEFKKIQSMTLNDLHSSGTKRSLKGMYNNTTFRVNEIAKLLKVDNSTDDRVRSQVYTRLENLIHPDNCPRIPRTTRHTIDCPTSRINRESKNKRSYSRSLLKNLRDKATNDLVSVWLTELKAQRDQIDGIPVTKTKVKKYKPKFDLRPKK